jgi:hypothetical protein
VHRQEVHDAVSAANRAATASSDEAVAALRQAVEGRRGSGPTIGG